jgi:hypothetical protein
LFVADELQKPAIGTSGIVLADKFCSGPTSKGIPEKNL